MNKPHTFLLQHCALSLGTTKSETRSQGAVTKHYPMARNHPRFWVAMQGESHESGIVRITGERGDLAIGGDFTHGNSSHHLIYGCIKGSDHTPIMARASESQQPFLLYAPRQETAQSIRSTPHNSEAAPVPSTPVPERIMQMVAAADSKATLMAKAEPIAAHAHKIAIHLPHSLLKRRTPEADTCLMERLSGLVQES
jgi:hypothetical protein